MKIWLRRNLFRTVSDSVITILSLLVIALVGWQGFQFVFITGRWDIIQVNLKLLLVGRFPEEQLWLLGLSICAIAFYIAAATASTKRTVQAEALFSKILQLLQRFGLIIGLGVMLIVLAGTLEALMLGLEVAGSIAIGRLLGFAKRHVSWLSKINSFIWQLGLALIPLTVIGNVLRLSELETWGGFLINFYIAVISIALSFPIGILLALARRSSMPIVRLISTSYIELIRGAPLFVLLLLAGVALEFFLPSSLSAPDEIARAVTVFTLFTAAYSAEIVRGGLQSISKGQTEAGKALGLNTIKIIFLITLPQALRNVIPAQIGQFISLFKDTTLAGAALGLFELLAIGSAITKQDDYLGQGLIYESLGFIALLFWVGSYVMSRESQRLERKLGVGTR